LQHSSTKGWNFERTGRASRLGDAKRLKGTHETMVLKGFRLKVPLAYAIAT
jgi:hypothetical protein